MPKAYTPPQINASTYINANNDPARMVTKPEPHRLLEGWTGASEASMERRLDMMGHVWFLDMMSVGYQIDELALTLGIRPSVLRAWLNRATTPDSIIEARRIGAAYYRTKSLRVIEGSEPNTTAELGYLKLKHEAYRLMAEAVDPGTWRPDPKASAAMGVANVTINMPDPTVMGGVRQTGPGIDPLDMKPIDNAEVLLPTAETLIGHTLTEQTPATVTPEPTQAPATPAPTQAPATPEPTQAPATPEPVTTTRTTSQQQDDLRALLEGMGIHIGL